jgi:hypothetical protein
LFLKIKSNDKMPTEHNRQAAIRNPTIAGNIDAWSNVVEHA